MPQTIQTPKGEITIYEDCRSNPVEYELLITRANGTVDSDVTGTRNKKGKMTYTTYGGVMRAVHEMLHRAMRGWTTLSGYPELEAKAIKVNMLVLDKEPITVFHAMITKDDNGTIRN